MSKPISHQMDVYSCWLHLATDKQAARTLARRYEQDYSAIIDGSGTSTDVHDVVENVRHYIIWLDPTISTERRRIETIAHEASHVAGWIVGQCGLEGTEARAYLVGWISQWIWENVTRA